MSETKITIDELDTASTIAPKQDALVSGTNIKTINGAPVLGSGNIPTNDPRVTVARKTSAQAITGAIGDVADMGITLAASATYRIEINLPISTSTGTSPTLQLGLTGPASPTYVNLRRTQMTSASAIATSVITSFTTFAAGASVANTHHTIEGIIVNGANAGTLQLRAAGAGTTPSITIAAGASIIATKIS